MQLTFFWVAIWLLDHHYYSFRLQPIASEELEWWQDAGNLFYPIVLLNIGIVVAALLAALLAYVFGCRTTDTDTKGTGKTKG